MAGRFLPTKPEKGSRSGSLPIILDSKLKSFYWEKKILRNMERDKETNLALLNMGWTVIRFWGSEIKRNPDACIAVIEECVFDQMVSDFDALGEYDCEEIDLE